MPSENVGGDIVDALELPDGGFFAYVADIAGHGLSAGVLMGMLKTSIRTQLLDEISLTAVFERLNRVLPAVKENHMYATCTALRLPAIDSTDMLAVEYAIAAQPPILHFRADAGCVARVGDEQLPIGLLPEARYGSHKLQVKAKDLLLIATDGIWTRRTGMGKRLVLQGSKLSCSNIKMRPWRTLLIIFRRRFGILISNQTIRAYWWLDFGRRSKSL